MDAERIAVVLSSYLISNKSTRKNQSMKLNQLKSVLKGAFAGVAAAFGLSVGAVELPEGYVAVDYIVAPCYSYLDTGYNANSNTCVKMDVTVKDKCEYWFGAWDSDWNDDAYALGNDNTGVYAGYGDDDTGTKGSVVGNGRHTVELSNRWVKVDGEITRTMNEQSFQLENTLYLFAQNRNGKAAPCVGQVDITCHGCKISEGSEVKRDFVPCVRIGDLAAGLYDLAESDPNKAFYANAGKSEYAFIPADGTVCTVTVGDYPNMTAAYTFGNGSVTNAIRGASFKVLKGTSGVKIIFTAKQYFKIEGESVVELEGAVTENVVFGEGNDYAVPKVSVLYLDWDEENGMMTNATITAGGYELVTSDTRTFADGKWYVVAGDVAINGGGNITVSGSAHLILCDDASLTAINSADNKAAIDVSATGSTTNSLTIYGQENGSGKLTARTYDKGAGIGTAERSETAEGCGVIVINGGTVTAKGGEGAGIGGGYRGAGGTVTINGGTVTATGGSYGAGIGGGDDGAGGTVTINGGTVTATGGLEGAGIGGGDEGAGGTVTINGGTVTATSGRDGAGIGGGFYGAGGTVTINGGTVTATGGPNGAAGIGGGYNGAGGTVMITGGSVVAQGGDLGAGIGGGKRGAGGRVTITGGAVKVVAGRDASVIGHGIDEYAQGLSDGFVSISGGIFGMEIADGWCAEGHGVCDNPDPVSATDYPWTVVALPLTVSLRERPEHATVAYTFGDGAETNTIDGMDFVVKWGTENVKVILTVEGKYQFADGSKVCVLDLLSPLCEGEVITPPQVEEIPPGTVGNPWNVGDDVAAYVSDEGTLVIGGTGAMDDFASAAEAPWNEIANALSAVTVADGVTHIGKNAFVGIAGEVKVNGTALSVYDMMAGARGFSEGGASPVDEIRGFVTVDGFSAIKIEDGMAKLDVVVGRSDSLDGSAEWTPVSTNTVEVPAPGEQGFFIVSPLFYIPGTDYTITGGVVDPFQHRHTR